MVAGSAVILALLGVVGPAVQTWSGTAPSGACTGYRVYIDVLGTGTYYCNAGTWATVSAGGSGAPTTAQYWVGAADGDLSAAKDLSGFTALVMNTAGVPSAYPGFECVLPSFVRVIAANGAVTCAQPTDTTGNAATATALSTTGSSGQFWSYNNTWATPSAGATSEITPVSPPTGGGACSPSDKVVIDTNGKWWTCDTGTWLSAEWGQVEQATHLKTNGTNCAAGEVALGVDTAGNAEGCYTGPADVVAVPIVTTAATSVLTNEQVLPTCTTGDVLTFNGTAISCTTPTGSGGGPVRTTLAANYTNASNTVWSTVLTISGLSASTRYELRCNLKVATDVTTTGARFRFTANGTMTALSVNFQNCSSTTALRNVTVNALSTSTGDTASAGTARCMNVVSGFFTTNTATNIVLEGVSEISLSNIYVDAGSSCTVEAY